MDDRQKAVNALQANIEFYANKEAQQGFFGSNNLYSSLRDSLQGKLQDILSGRVNGNQYEDAVEAIRLAKQREVENDYQADRRRILIYAGTGILLVTGIIVVSRMIKNKRHGK